MKKKDEKRSVGRPKLADTKTKKKALIISIICLIVAISLLIVGAYNLNIFRLRGDASDIFKKGDEFCLGSECFYTISENEDGTITALAKYNLLVGNQVTVDEQAENIESNEEINPSSEGYGLQSSTATGYDYSNTSWIGTIAYSEDNYWGGSNEILDEYGDGSNIFGIDSREASSENNLTAPLNNYKDYLIGITNVSDENMIKVSLLNMDSKTKLMCNDEGDCDEYNIPSWAYSTNYWTAIANDYQTVTAIDKYNSKHTENADYYTDYMYGVRPTITISKTLIPENRGLKYKPHTLAEKICLKENDEECFYILDMDDETITMIAENNLLVGDSVQYNVVNEETGEVEITNQDPISEDTEGYGWQIKGDYANYGDGSGNAYAVVQYVLNDNSKEKYYWVNGSGSVIDDYKLNDSNFSDIAYIYDENSNLSKYFDAYQTKLKTLLDTDTIEVRALNVYDYYNFVMAGVDEESIMKVLMSSTFWSGLVTTDAPDFVLSFMKENEPNIMPPYMALAGVKPVIKINRIDLEPEKKQEQNNNNNQNTDNNSQSTDNNSNNQSTNNGSGTSNNNGATTSNNNNITSGNSTSTSTKGTVGTNKSGSNILSSSKSANKSSNIISNKTDDDSKKQVRNLANEAETIIDSANNASKITTSNKLLLVIIVGEVILIALLIIKRFRKGN